jgi:hypothetical protein
LDPNGLAALIVAMTTFITGIGALIVGARRKDSAPAAPSAPAVPGTNGTVAEQYRTLLNEVQEERAALRTERDIWRAAALRYRDERDECRRRLAAGELGAGDTSDGPEAPDPA